MKLQAKLNYFITMIGKGLKAKGSITEPGGVQDSWISKSRKASEVHYFMWDFWISVDLNLQLISMGCQVGLWHSYF